jgi:hypothetical protein
MTSRNRQKRSEARQVEKRLARKPKPSKKPRSASFAPANFGKLASEVGLDPAPDLGFVAQIFVAKFLFEIGFFRFDHAFLQNNCKWQDENQNP